MNMATNAGPQPQTVLEIPSRAVSIRITIPSFENSPSTHVHCTSESEWRRSQMTIPSQTETGVLGMVDKWAVPGASIRSVIVERDACGHRNDDLLSQQFPDGCHDRLDLVGFHGDNHDVGKLRDSRGIVERPEPVGLRVAQQFRTIARTRADIPGLDGFPANQAVREGLRHIPESDKSDFHSLSGLVYLSLFRRQPSGAQRRV